MDFSSPSPNKSEPKPSTSKKSMGLSVHNQKSRKCKNASENVKKMKKRDSKVCKRDCGKNSQTGSARTKKPLGTTKESQSAKAPKRRSKNGKIYEWEWTAQEMDERPHVCSFCTYRSASKKDLKRHQLVHTQAKDYKCFICNKMHGRKDNLCRHIKRVHHKEVIKAKELANKADELVKKKKEAMMNPSNPIKTGSKMLDKQPDGNLGKNIADQVENSAEQDEELNVAHNVIWEAKASDFNGITITDISLTSSTESEMESDLTAYNTVTEEASVNSPSFFIAGKDVTTGALEAATTTATQNQIIELTENNVNEIPEILKNIGAQLPILDTIHIGPYPEVVSTDTPVETESGNISESCITDDDDDGQFKDNSRTEISTNVEQIHEVDGNGETPVLVATNGETELTESWFNKALPYIEPFREVNAYSPILMNNLLTSIHEKPTNSTNVDSTVVATSNEILANIFVSDQASHILRPCGTDSKEMIISNNSTTTENSDTVINKLQDDDSTFAISTEEKNIVNASTSASSLVYDEGCEAVERNSIPPQDNIISSSKGNDVYTPTPEHVDFDESSFDETNISELIRNEYHALITTGEESGNSSDYSYEEDIPIRSMKFLGINDDSETEEDYLDMFVTNNQQPHQDTILLPGGDAVSEEDDDIEKIILEGEAFLKTKNTFICHPSGYRC